jgi:hypothetical protein
MEVIVAIKQGSRTKERASRARVALKNVERQIEKLVATIRELERMKTPAGSGPRRTLKLSPGRKAALKLQGAYMGFMRQLGPRQQNRVKAVKAAKGLPAAIKLAKQLAAK